LGLFPCVLACQAILVYFSSPAFSQCARPSEFRWFYHFFEENCEANQWISNIYCQTFLNHLTETASTCEQPQLTWVIGYSGIMGINQFLGPAPLICHFGLCFYIC
jgi:hypothetical protein